MNLQDDQQTEILRGIWNEMKAVKSSPERKLDATRQELRAEIHEVKSELTATRQGLGHRIDALGSGAQVIHPPEGRGSWERFKRRRFPESDRPGSAPC